MENSVFDIDVQEEVKAKQPKPVAGILSLIFGILACMPFKPFACITNIAFPILAVVLGNRGIAKSLGARMGKVGKILGLINLILLFVAIVAAFLLLSLHWNVITGQTV